MRKKSAVFISTTSDLLMMAFLRNSVRTYSTAPGLLDATRRHWRYNANTCFCSWLCRIINNCSTLALLDGKCSMENRTYCVQRCFQQL